MKPTREEVVQVIADHAECARVHGLNGRMWELRKLAARVRKEGVEDE